LTFAFGIYALMDGVLALMSLAAHRPEGSMARPALLLEGIAGIGFGVLTMTWPQITVLVLLYFVAAWAFVTGVLEITAAIQLRHELSHEWLLGLGGVISIVFAGLLIVYPTSGVLTLLFLTSAYALVFGALLLTLAWRRRSHGSTPARA
jgi:uncharacterized membrane protein HdeD (DUF308 family)